MSNEVQVTFNIPQRASQFLAMIEDRAEYGWVGFLTMSGGFTFALRGTRKGPRDDEHAYPFRVTFESFGRAAVVYIDGVNFRLNDLCQPGAVWDPWLYPNNPFMPMDGKKFLDELIYLLSGIKLMRCLPSGGREYAAPQA